MTLPFLKMHGAGNDFVIFDARKAPLALTPAQIRALASRGNATTKGCDQVIVIEPSQHANAFMRIYNADGGEVNACGNATRCVGALLLEEQPIVNVVLIETKAGLLHCSQSSNAFFGKDAQVMMADMGPPHFNWKDIPLGRLCAADDLAHIVQNYGLPGFQNALCVGMGNPHVVFFTHATPPDNAIIQFFGKKLQNHPIFSTHGVNVTIANASGNGAIASYVWERGVGLTASCGTAACATGVAAIMLGYRAKDTDIHIIQQQKTPLDLFIRWREKDDQVSLIGPVALEFKGKAEMN